MVLSTLVSVKPLVVRRPGGFSQLWFQLTDRVGFLAEGRLPRVHESLFALREPCVDFLLRLLRVPGFGADM